MSELVKNKGAIGDDYPVLIKWAVKYDDYFAMPEYIQGKMIGTAKEYPNLFNGQVVNIRDIEVFDMYNKLLKTSKGQKFYLSGSGHRIFVVDNDKVMDYQMEKIEDDIYE